MHALFASAAAGAAVPLGQLLPLWSALPFAGILGSLALLPLVAPHFWHRHFPKVSAFWALAFAVPFLAAWGSVAGHAILHVLLADYVPFLVLIWGLYTVSGGIVLRGNLRGTPGTNVTLLFAGTLLASWIGTTGAAMVLIRPLLRANAGRRHRTHTVVFFIFLVANIGGVLTPLGDPPLFLGYLHGVPFFWTARLLRELVVCMAVLLPLYALIEHRLWVREGRPGAGDRAPMRPRLAGSVNLLLLLGIVGAVLLSGSWKPGAVHVLGIERGIADLVRDGLILVLGGLSLALTARELRRENEFSWGPVREVAYLFAGIFVTMIPALEILRAGTTGAMAPLVSSLSGPASFFWATGMLSSVLDNAPTYLAFYSTALGRLAPGQPEAEALRALLTTDPAYLEAVSAGAVFMGANTYIGNAPNFMVKAIAEEAGVAMPSFLGYVARWSLPVLVPLFVLVTLFLRG